MKTKGRFWQIASLIIAAVLILNPELAELALFINMVGIDTFLLLVEVQLIALTSYWLKNKLNYYFFQPWVCFKSTIITSTLSISTQALLMNLLALITVITFLLI